VRKPLLRIWLALIVIAAMAGCDLFAVKIGSYNVKNSPPYIDAQESTNALRDNAETYRELRAFCPSQAVDLDAVGFEMLQAACSGEAGGADLLARADELLKRSGKWLADAAPKYGQFPQDQIAATSRELEARWRAIRDAMAPPMYAADGGEEPDAVPGPPVYPDGGPQDPAHPLPLPAPPPPYHGMPQPTPGATPADTTQASVDEYIDGLKAGLIKPEAPHQLERDREGLAMLVIGEVDAQPQMDAAIAEALKGEGQAITNTAAPERVKIGPLLAARLTLLQGAGLEITPLGTENRTRLGGAIVKWEWKLKAKEPCHCRIRFELLIRVPLEGPAGMQEIPYQEWVRDVDVTVTADTRRKDLFMGIKHWLFGGVEEYLRTALMAGLGLLGAFLIKRIRKQEQPRWVPKWKRKADRSDTR
jgi:hypothetical protein